MRVLMVYPSLEIAWDRIKAYAENVRRPSLGLQYLMAVMQDARIDFTYRDMVFARVTLDELVAEIAREGYDVVGLHANNITKDDVCRIIRSIKSATRSKVLLGGPDGSLGSSYIAAGADCICVGEAESRFVPILKALTGEGSLEDIEGVWFRRSDGEVVRTPDAPFIADLDAIPFPYRDPSYMSMFGEPVNPAQTGSYISLIASRGCPYKCTFCYAHQVWEHKVRFRSVDNVLDEMGQVLHTWKRPYFTFVDDVWGLDRGWAEEFCRKKIERGYKFNWMCIVHPLSYAGRREKLLGLMAKAGCNCISYGAQSSSPMILKNIRRSPSEPQDLAEHLALCRRNRILTIVTWIFGLPGETAETMEESIRWCIKHRPYLADFHPLHVIPGTQIHQEYGDAPVTTLSTPEIERACARGFRQFYTNPLVALQMAEFIVRRNPRYLLRLGTPLKRLFIHMASQEKDLPAEPAVEAT